MRNLTKALLTLCVCAAALTVSAQNITLAWEYPGIVDDDLEFVVYHSPTLAQPLSAWAVFTNTPGNRTYCDLEVTPGANYFYVVAASIFWGTNTAPSNVASTPALPAPAINARVTRKH